MEKIKITDKTTNCVCILNAEKVIAFEIYKVTEQLEIDEEGAPETAEFLEVMIIMENRVYIDNQLYCELSEIEYI